MATNITEVEGIGPANQAKLAKAGVKSVEGLLKAGSTSKGRMELAQITGVNDNHILTWVNMADLFRIRGVGSEYAELLQASGVDTVVELSKRVPQNLHAKMLEINKSKKLVRQTPALKSVEDWVAQAKTLPRVVTY